MRRDQQGLTWTVETEMPVRRAVSVALLAACAAGACGGESTAEDWTVSMDTLGATARVTNTPPDAGGIPTLLGTAELRVGSVEGGTPASFGLIRSMAVLEDGRIAVADGQAQEIRLFDSDGRHLRTFGGEGAGPGELRGLQGVYVDHEGLLRVAEQANGRLSVFHPDSGFVRSYPLRLFSYGFRGPWGAAVAPDGRTFVISSGPIGEGRYGNMIRVYDPEMRQLDAIPYHDYTDDVEREEQPGAWRISLGGSAFTWAGVPFYARPYELISADGGFWTSADGAQYLQVTRWTPGGDTTLVLQSRRLPVPVTAAERDSAMATLVAGLASRMPNPPKLDPGKVPPTKPPLYGLSLDERGRLWVRLTEPTVEPTLYDVFDRDGRHAETVSLPFRVDAWIPPTVSGDTLWAVVVDEVDVQHVVRVRLRPTEED